MPAKDGISALRRAAAELRAQAAALDAMAFKLEHGPGDVDLDLVTEQPQRRRSTRPSSS